MAQGNLRDAMQYAAKNPNTDFARQLKERIETGAADSEAASLGIDLSSFGRPYKPAINMNLPTPNVTPGTVPGEFESPFERTTKSAGAAALQKSSSGLDMMDRAQNPKQYVQGAMQFGAGGIEAGFAPIAGVIDQMSENKSVQDAGQHPAIGKILDALGGLQKKYEGSMPEEMRRDLLNLFTIGSMGIAPDAAGVAGAGARAGAKAVEQTAKDAAIATAKSTAGVAGDVLKGAKAATGKIPNPLVEPLPKPVVSALKESDAAMFDQYATLAKGASESFKNQTPLEFAGTRAQKALDIIQKQMSTAGEAKRNLMNIGTMGLTPVKKNILEKFNQGIQSLKNSGVLVEGDAKLVQTIQTALKQFKESSTVTANQVDRFIDQMQDELYTSSRNLTIPVTDKLTGRLQKLVGELNSGLKQQLPAKYQEMNQVYHDLIKVRDELNTKLGKEGERGGALMKRVFSPSDNNTRVLFQSVKDKTGIDLINEATIARFVMDTVGDTRQKSMLQQLDLPLNKASIPSWMFGKVKEWVNSPESLMQRARQETQGGAPEKVNYDNLNMGLSMKKNTDVGISPEKVAPNVNGEDVPAILDYIENSSFDNYMKVKPTLDGMGIGEMDPMLAKRFLQEVIDVRNAPEKGGVIEGASKKGTAAEKIPATPEEVLKTAKNQIQSVRQLMDNFSPEQIKEHGGLQKFLESSKNNIVTGIEKMDARAAEAVKKLNPDDYGSVEAFERDVLYAIEESKKAPGGTPNMQDRSTRAGNKFTGSMPTFKGFTDLTTKLLEDLKGRAQVSKQYILDATNRADLKQPERDLFRQLLAEEGPDINVKEFANKVKTELLPLTRTQAGKIDGKSMANKYESVTLSDDLRGPVANYDEHVYRSPIKTSAGDVHFSGEPNYFAHTRIEDLPERLATAADDMADTVVHGQGVFAKRYVSGDTRRVIEIQSDLFQKGRLEGERSLTRGRTEFENLPPQEQSEMRSLQKAITEANGMNDVQNKRYQELLTKNDRLGNPKRAAELDKLEPYRNTWHERVIREEVKQAAKDGKTKLQFPTGETAMKIEGLVNRHDKWVTLDNELITDGANFKEGDLITYQTHEGTPDDYRRFLVTKNNKDGTFRAVDNLTAENDGDFYKFLEERGYLDDGQMPSLDDLIRVHGADKEMLTKLDKLAENLSAQNTVDKNNPIYKFYEKDVQKYLAKKYGGKVITDPQGVKWVEIDIPKQYAKMPIEAFAAIPFMATSDND